MKTLIVCSANSGRIIPFITEQADALRRNNVEVDFFTVNKKGIKGYLQSRKPLTKKIKEFQPDIIHAHFGVSGILANLQRKVPVVTTFHGCDINKFTLRLTSFFPLLFSEFNIFVSVKQKNKVRYIAGKNDIIPCGIDLNYFGPSDKQEQRKALGWDKDKKYILFSSTFTRPEKNPALAQEAMKLLPGYELIEFKGFEREQIKVVMNACDAGLLTSIREGSPMFIKEMMACKRPLVSTNVGDVEDQLTGVKGCEIVDFDVEKVAEAIKRVVKYERIEYDISKNDKFDNDIIASKLIDIYKQVVNL